MTADHPNALKVPLKIPIKDTTSPTTSAMKSPLTMACLASEGGAVATKAVIRPTASNPQPKKRNASRTSGVGVLFT